MSTALASLTSLPRPHAAPARRIGKNGAPARRRRPSGRGCALVNVSPNALTVTVEIFTSNGQPAPGDSTLAVELQPFNMTQVNDVLARLAVGSEQGMIIRAGITTGDGGPHPQHVAPRQDRSYDRKRAHPSHPARQRPDAERPRRRTRWKARRHIRSTAGYFVFCCWALSPFTSPS